MRLVIAGVLYMTVTACAGGGTASVDAPPKAHDAAQSHDGSAATDATTIDGTLAADAAVPCKQPSVLHGDGHHNAGLDCMGSCHNHGFSVAGTLYESSAGATAVAGATVTIVDATGNSQDIITSTNGNFFSFFPVSYPITITASLCPSTQTMVNKPSAGGCNATGCHEAGGVQGPLHL